MGRTRRDSRGYTLIELCVAMVVLAILAMIAIPDFMTTVRRHRLQATVSGLQAAIAYARTEAVLRQYSVSVCPSTDARTCVANSNDYSGGWLVYASQGTSHAVYAAGATMSLLRAGQSDGHSAVLASTSTPISFGPQGQVVGGAAFTMVACARSGTSGAGQSTTAVPGQLITVSAQGSFAAQSLAAQTSCQAPVVS